MKEERCWKNWKLLRGKLAFIIRSNKDTICFVYVCVCVSILSLDHEAASHSHRPVSSSSVLRFLLWRRDGHLRVKSPSHKHKSHRLICTFMSSSNQYHLQPIFIPVRSWYASFIFFIICFEVEFKIKTPCLNLFFFFWAVNNRCWALILLFSQLAAGGAHIVIRVLLLLLALIQTYWRLICALLFFFSLFLLVFIFGKNPCPLITL